MLAFRSGRGCTPQQATRPDLLTRCRTLPSCSSRCTPRAAVAAGPTADDASANEPAPPSEPPAASSSSPVAAGAKAKEAATKQRTRRRALSWQDASTPNTGLVRVTQRGGSAAAAALVVKDLEAAALTRIVAAEPRECARLVDVLQTATLMQNGRVQQPKQQQQQQQDAGQAAEQQQQQQQQQQSRQGALQEGKLLLWQPVQVTGALVAPPQLPEGATVFYTHVLPSDTPALQAALAQRAQQREAADAGAGPGSPPGVIGVSARSDVSGAARAISAALLSQGWAEVASTGGSMALTKAVQSISKARGVLHSNARADAAAVLLDVWDKVLPARERQWPQQQPADDAAPAPAATPASAAGAEDDGAPAVLRLKCASFLLLCCKKNTPKALLDPAAAVAVAAARSDGAS